MNTIILMDSLMIALSLVLFWVGRRRESPFLRAAAAAFLTSATVSMVATTPNGVDVGAVIMLTVLTFILMFASTCLYMGVLTIENRYMNAVKMSVDMTQRP